MAGWRGIDEYPENSVHVPGAPGGSLRGLPAAQTARDTTTPNSSVLMNVLGPISPFWLDQIDQLTIVRGQSSRCLRPHQNNRQSESLQNACGLPHLAANPIR
jgi:hypothetical protein